MSRAPYPRGVGQTASETAQAGTVRVAIVEDQREIREGLAALIQGTPGFRCTRVFPSAEQALAALAEDLPDLVLMDIQLPAMSGIEAIRLLKQRHPDVVFLVLSVYDDDERIFQALCAGASGYLLKGTPPARLLDSLREAVDGGGPLSPEVAQRVISLFRRYRPLEKSDCELTPHEIRVLSLLVDGHDYRSAAVELHVRTSTVIYHMRQIFRKLQVHSKSDAVAKALRAGLIR